MTAKDDHFLPYSTLPSNPNPNPNPNPYPYPPSQNVVVLLPRYRPRSHLNRSRCLLYSTLFLLLILLAVAVFFLYPSDPEIRLARIRLNHIAIRALPRPTLDLSFFVTVRVRNKNFFSLSYRSLTVSVGYRGRQLGIVTSGGDKVSARASSYVDASLTVDGIEVIFDALYLLEDLAKGVIPFDADTKVEGKLGLFFFDIPLKATVSCQVDVDVKNQTITHQDCYPKSLGDPLDQSAYVGAGETHDVV